MINYRRCLSCRRLAPKSEFLRVVRSHPDQRIEINQGMGRSAYLCPTPECLGVAQRKNRLAKAIKAPVPQHVYQQLWQHLPQYSEAKLS